MGVQSRQSNPATSRLPGGPEVAPDPSANGFSARVRVGTTSTVVTPVGELDLATVDEFDRVLWGAQRRTRSVVVDLRALEFIDSAGLRSLVGAKLRAASWQGHLEVVCAGGQVQRLLTLTGMDRLLNIIAPLAPQPRARPVSRDPDERDRAVV